MLILAVSYALAVLVAGWAVWVCRLSFQSPWNSPKAITLALFGLGAALDSPWRAFAAASFPLTGKYYVLTVIGHICYLGACVFGIKQIYLRLLSDEAIGPFMKKRMAPVISCAAIVMVVFFAASPATSSLTADYFYRVRPDGWLIVYWLVYYGTLTALLCVAMYGTHQLRRDPRSVMVDLLMVALALGALSSVVSAVGMVTGRNTGMPTLAWAAAYAGIAVGSAAAAFAWRRRMRNLLPRSAD